MRKSMIAAATVLGLGMLGMPASAELPPSLNPLRFNVYLNSETGQINRSVNPLLDVETGTGSITLDETEQGFGPLAGVEYTLQVDVNADPMVAYTLTLVNGSDVEIPLQLIVGSPMEPFDETFDAQHSLTVDLVDGGASGATLTPDQFNFDRTDRTLQQAFVNAADLLNPPFAQTFGEFVGDGDLFSSDSPLGPGRTTDISGPRALPTPGPNVGQLTPDGKYNGGAMNVAFKLSAGDTVTLTGKLEIAKGLGGGGGGGGDEPFGPFGGTLDGKLQAKAKKIATVKDKEHMQVVTLTESTFSMQLAGTTVNGAAAVKKGGKSIKLTLDAAGQAQLAQAIGALFSAAAGQAVTVTFKKDPKGKASVKKDGAKSKFALAAKGTATMGEVSKGFNLKISAKGALSGDN